MSGAGLEVNEAVIWASRRGNDWWNEWRILMERTGRITIVTPSLGGDLVYVACDSDSDARWLADHMTGFAGIPARAVKVKRAKAGTQ